MKILIIGASGQVGANLMTAAKELGHQALGTYRTHAAAELLYADITDNASLSAAFDAARPQCVILASSLTAVDYCQTHPQQARAVNVDGTARVAALCKQHGAIPVFLSTEYVFDGVNGPYDETAPINPQSVYAQTKADGEKLILADDGLVIRTTVVYSYDPAGLNFVMQLARNLPQGKTMTVPSDQYSNPTYAPDLARAVIELAQAGHRGIFNVVGPDRLNRYEFALKICAALGLDAALITPKTTAQLNQAAPRPLYAGLIPAKLTAATGRVPVSVDEGLARIKHLIAQGGISA